MTTPPTRPAWNQDTKRIVVIIALIIAALLIYMVRSMLSLVVLSAVVAYLFQPLVGFLERHRVPRGAGAALSMLLLFLGALLAPTIMAPALINGFSDILTALALLPGLLQQWIPAFLERTPTLEILGFKIALAEVISQAEQVFVQASQEVHVPTLTEMVDYLIQGVKTAGGILGIATNLLTGVVSAIGATAIAAVLFVMYTFFLTKDAPQLRDWLHAMILPEFWPEWERLLARLHLTWQNFFRGQILLSLSIGIVTWIAGLILGLPAAFVLGLLAGILEVIPNLGPVLAAIPAILVALVQGSRLWPVDNFVFALIVIGVYALIQQIENNFFVPRIIGQSLDLHPMLVLIGVVSGTATVGILGAFLAAPVLASLKVLWQFTYCKLTDQEPFLEPMRPEAQVQQPRRWARLKARVVELRARMPARSPITNATVLPPSSDVLLARDDSGKDAASHDDTTPQQEAR